MTLLAVPIMVEDLEHALRAAMLAGEGGADVVEYRVDRVADDIELVKTLVDRSPLPCLLTCRPVWEGGDYDGAETDRISLIEAAGLVTRPPAYVDVELKAYESSANLRQKVHLVVEHDEQVRRVEAGLILSSHDFEGRPSDLLRRVSAMVDAEACRVVKLAWRARSIRDNLEAFDLSAETPKPTIALCMGEFGLPSRVLAKKFGAHLTFASLDAASGTAPGQPTLEQMKRLYRWDRIGPETKVFGVIGHPVGHSLSPAIHNAGFDAVHPDPSSLTRDTGTVDFGFDGVYLPLPVAPGYEPFKASVGAWLDHEKLDFCGASVTLPHKEHLLRFVAERGGEIEALASRIAAANTLTVREDGSLYASNTDYAAALDALCDGLEITWEGLRGLRVAVLGAGGVARALVAGFAYAGAEVVIVNRTAARAEALASAFDGGATMAGGSARVSAKPMDVLCAEGCDAVVNCTSVGMHPDVGVSPASPELFEGRGRPRVVFDTIYNPRMTRLLVDAASAGCRVVTGDEMFVRQAAGQFELWTQHPAPVGVFRQVMAEALGV
ncbi:type I 3-dehydroquinate dehydratase [Mucisphaera calidilacus]|uniref:Multifunctional fusion protein n=1 Tax=Mucisphaera calidilacus TaxID=2527982 RepID=A0A518C0E1_9BACT|nr:type I 3-dehydroquinate dehydratase [Mucisphaera calidilacus]QDU72695.1 Shikimate dehydrogenase [Mucisphaera calidilacus]